MQVSPLCQRFLRNIDFPSATTDGFAKADFDACWMTTALNPMLGAVLRSSFHKGSEPGS